MFTLLLYCFLTAGGSAAMGAYFRRWLALEKSVGSVSALTLLALCVQAAAAVVIGAYSLRAAGIVLCAAQSAAIAALALDGTAAGVWKSRRNLPPVLESRFGAICLVIVALVLAVSFVSAMAPVTAWDAGVAHLAVAARYAAHGRIGEVSGNNYCAYPQLLQTWFALALQFPGTAGDAAEIAGGTERLASVTTWWFAVLACVAAYALGDRLAGKTCGAIAAANLATAPIFGDQAVSPSIDIAFTATAIAALYAIIIWREKQAWSQLALAAALAGSGCGIRHTGYLVTAFLCVGVAATKGARARNVLVFAGIAFVFACPWFLHAWRVSGNPLYPFFSSRFTNGAMPDIDVAAIGTHSSLQGTGVLRLLAFPWSLTMDPAHYGGWATSPGAVWLVLGAIGIVAGDRRARGLGAFSAAGLAAIFYFQRFARYALPFLAPMMAVAALPYEQLPKLRRLIVAVLLVSYTVGAVPALANAAMRLPVVVGGESRDNYLERHVERYAAMHWIAQETPRGAVVLSLDPRGYYFDRPAITNFEALKQVSLWDKTRQYDWLRTNAVTYFFYPDAYVRTSPAFRVTGVGAMIDSWRSDAAHFALVKEFDLPNPRAGGTERVEVYEFKP